MKKDLVSIITPCYNGAKFVQKTIESVIKQTYTNWEMIIVDDGSKDESAKIINEWTKKDGRIHYIYQNNAGSAVARNNGINKAEGQYIALLDADDLWEPIFLEEQIRLLKEKKAICVYSSYRRIDERDKEILRPTIVKDMITCKDMMVRDYIGCLTGVYDCSKYGKIYLKKELKSIRDDYAYWLDVVNLEGVAYGNTKVLASYRVLSSSVTGNKLKLIYPQYKFYRRYLKLGRIKSMSNMLKWGVAGIRHFGIRSVLPKRKKRSIKNEN